MATTKEVSILLLLILYAAICTPENAQAKLCPSICLDAQYMTCESSGEEKLKPVCSCCLAPQNCTLYFADGTSENCN
ncbi:hypothetical protein SLE2022_237350 [Rubroshorea leprosula]